ncbi:MAG: 16S rRNA (guanine(966)-N(2))-methyltransferase RsmD [Defluviitaleaceae bacterium]|nr:16S rRNA (guanine(966)-N(2))-methyltransferase RsmD [Defluviitaleaceae bacterium]
MRVIAGRLRGAALFAPGGDGVRPTADRVKEDLFNIIAPDVAEASFLDVYCGTGQIGIEALSRGAESVVFVEADKQAAELVAKNIAKCKMSEESTLIRTDAQSAFKKLEALGRTFSIVFLDPPYAADELVGAIRALARGRLLREGALVIIEQPADALPCNTQKLQVYKEKKYAATKLTFLRYTGERDTP